jgi:cysteine desulfurase
MIAYLDNSATTRPCPEAVEAIGQMLTDCWGNPSSVHRLGVEAHRRLDLARRQVAEAMGAEPERVFFTSGGTEADNQALRGAAHLGRRRGGHVVSSAVEHDAVLKTLAELSAQGWEVTLLPPEKSGRIPLSAVAEALREDTVLVSLMLVNNETGAVNDVAGVRKLLREKGSAALLHTDAVQAFCKLPFRPGDLGADLITLSAHKIGGPKGAGALWVREGLRLPPLLFGGGQEGGLRSGTEAMPAIAGFGAAAAAASGTGSEKAQEHYLRLRKVLAQALPEALLLGKDTGDCAGHICSLSFPGARAEVLQNWLDREGVCVSRGSACAKGRRSHVLTAIGLPPAVIDGSLRISFSNET